MLVITVRGCLCLKWKRHLESWKVKSTKDWKDRRWMKWTIKQLEFWRRPGAAERRIGELRTIGAVTYGRWLDTRGRCGAWRHHTIISCPHVKHWRFWSSPGRGGQNSVRKLIFVKVQSLETPMNHDALMSQHASVGSSDPRPRHRSPRHHDRQHAAAPHSKWKLIFKFRKPIPNLICRFWHF